MLHCWAGQSLTRKDCTNRVSLGKQYGTLCAERAAREGKAENLFTNCSSFPFSLSFLFSFEFLALPGSALLLLVQPQLSLSLHAPHRVGLSAGVIWLWLSRCGGGSAAGDEVMLRRDVWAFNSRGSWAHGGGRWGTGDSWEGSDPGRCAVRKLGLVVQIVSAIGWSL